MYPKEHIVLGALFSAIVSMLFPNINLFYLALIFLSSFLIDFDHYMIYVIKTKNFSLNKAFDYHITEGKMALKEKAKGIRKKGHFHVFHTLEFLILVYILSFLWYPFIFILIGMIFHSLLDIIYLITHDFLYRREFFLTRWLMK